MTPQIISLIVSGLALLLILFQVMIGAIRGLKKSTFRLLWVAGFGLVCVLASSLIAKAIVNMDFSFLHLKFNGETLTTLPAYITKMMERANPDIANMVADNPQLLELATAMASCIFSVVLFEILFWVSKILLWPIWAILSHVFFGKKKNVGDNQKEVKVKKHSGYGALVGIGLGLIVCLFTFVPLATLNKVVLQVEAETAVEQTDGTTKGILSSNFGEYAEYINVYEDSYVAKAFKYTGINAVQLGFADILTSTKYNGETITLTKEISNFTPLYKDYVKIKDYNLSNLSKQDITEILPIADNAQKVVLGSHLVKSVYQEIAPYLAKNILTNENYFIKMPKTNNEFVNEVMENVVRAFFGITSTNEIDETKLIKIDDISDDISKMIEVAGLVNEADILSKIISREISLEYVQEKLSVQLGNDIVDKFFEMKTINTLLPVVVEPSIEYGIDQIPAIEIDGENKRVTYTEVSGGVTAENLKNFLKSVVSNVVTTFKNADIENYPYISTTNFSNFGAIVDKLKTSNVISTYTYNSAVEYGKAYANKFVDDGELNNYLKNIVKDIIDTLDDVESFETEMNYVGQAVQEYFDAESVDEVAVCKIIDKIKPSIFYTANINSIISNLTSFATQFIEDNSISVSTDNIATIFNSIRNIESFEAEYNKIKDVYEFISEIVGSENVADEFLKEENLRTFGQKLDADKRKQSVILSDANVRLLINSLIDGVELPEELAEYKVNIKNNIQNIESYETELPYIAKALAIADIETTGRQQLVDIGEVLDNVKASVVFGNIIPTIVIDYIDKEIGTRELDENIASIVTKVKQNISNSLVYKTEFGFVYDTINADISSIGNLKTFLQTKLLNADGTSKSQVITTEILYDCAIDMAENIEIQDVDIIDDIVDALNEDKENEESLLDVLSQLEGLKTKVDNLKNVPSATALDRSYLTNLGDEIDKLKNEENFGLIINLSATQKIGDYIAELINDSVQNEGSMPAEKKNAVNAVYQDLENYKTETATNYKQMFTDYADALQLA